MLHGPTLGIQLPFNSLLSALAGCCCYAVAAAAANNNAAAAAAAMLLLLLLLLDTHSMDMEIVLVWRGLGRLRCLGE